MFQFSILVSYFIVLLWKIDSYKSQVDAQIHQKWIAFKMNQFFKINLFAQSRYMNTVQALEADC